MKTRINYFSILFSVIFLFDACRKYPENNLWFKHPGKVLGERDYDSPWILDYYSVNDVDSTSQDFLKAYKEIGVYMLRGNKKSIEFRCPGIIGGFIRFNDTKEKYIEFHYVNSNFHTDGSGYFTQRNIFLDPNIKWKIQKINKKSFWVIGEYSNLKCEIHFK
jgi:hypothetical protein